MAKEDKNIEYIMLPDPDAWMTTFSDMVTLLITFFVLLISMASMDDRAFKEVFGFFNDAAGPLEFSEHASVQGLPTLVGPARAKLNIDATSLNRELLNSLSEESPGGKKGRGQHPVSVRETGRGLAIMIEGDLLFAPGSAALAPQAMPVLEGVVAVISKGGNSISVEGHTDATGSDRGNWLLSLRRAQSVLDFFVYQGGMSPTMFCLAGYGATRPVAENVTGQGRAKNRRVEIVLLKDIL